MVTGRCAVYRCSNTSNRELNISLLCFPKKSDPRCKTWIQFCKRSDLFDPEQARICSKNVAEDCFNLNYKSELMNIRTKRTLKDTSIPTLNPPRPASLSPTSAAAGGRAKRATTKRKQSQMVLDILEGAESKVMKEDCPAETCKSVAVQSNLSLNEDVTAILSENVRLRSQVNELHSKVKALKVENTRFKAGKKSSDSQMDNILDGLRGAFGPGQVKCLLERRTSTKWSLEDLKFAVSFRAMSKKAYMFLRTDRGLPLPGLSTLHDFIAKLPCSVGMLSTAIDLLAQYLSERTEQDRFCVLSYDEMSLQRTIEYDKGDDRIYGPHKTVQVIMMRGLFGKWKQPVYYDFDARMTKDILFGVIRYLEERNLPVVACVSDMGGSNRGLRRDLGTSTYSPYIQHPCSSTRKLFFFADVPHLLKLIRNHAMKPDGFTVDGVRVNKALFQRPRDKDQGELRLLFKLSSLHLDCEGTERQRVYLAAQVLSDSVAHAIEHIEPQSSGAAACIRTIDRWFDVMNSRIPVDKKKMLCSGYGKQLEHQEFVLDSMIKMADKLRVGASKVLLPFQTGIIRSSIALKGLFSEMQSQFGITYILTHRLNQDCLENLFSQIRGLGQFYDNPSPLTVKYRIRMLLVGGHSGQVLGMSNIEQTDEVRSNIASVDVMRDVVLEQPSAAPQQPEQQQQPEEIINILHVADVAPRANGNDADDRDFEEEAKEYLSGRIAQKFRLTHRELGTPTAIATPAPGSKITWTHKKSRGGLLIPSKTWFDACSVLEEYFKERNGKGIRKMKTLKSLLAGAPSLDGVPQEACKLYLRTRLYIRIKHLTKALKDQKMKKSQRGPKQQKGKSKQGKHTGKKSRKMKKNSLGSKL